MYISKYVHTYTHTYMHPYVHMHAHTYIHTYMDVCMHACMHMCKYIHIHACITQAVLTLGVLTDCVSHRPCLTPLLSMVVWFSLLGCWVPMDSYGFLQAPMGSYGFPIVAPMGCYGFLFPVFAFRVIIWAPISGPGRRMRILKAA